LLSVILLKQKLQKDGLILMQMKWTIKVLILLAIPPVALIIVFALPRPSVEIEQPRPAMWPYPSVEQATYTYWLDDAGKLRIHLLHPVLQGVTPKMLAWWYQNLAIGQAEFDDVMYTYYRLFHLSEHGQNRILEPSTDGSPSMGVGALVYRQETFGPYASKGQARVLEFGPNGYLVAPVMGPFSLGLVKHTFELVATGGTLYTVEIELGSDIPVLGYVLNKFIQMNQFSPPVITEWLRHQVEEVGSLVHYLPDLYTAEH
jgi:hypothetical protein